MPKSPRKKSPPRPPHPGARTSSAPAPSPSPAHTTRALPVFLAGLLLGLAALTSSAALAYSHFSKATLPGCGAAAACASINAHPVGSIGGLGVGITRLREGGSLSSVLRGDHKVLPDQAFLPMSLVGTAWFLALLAAWVAWGLTGGSRAGNERALRLIRALARIGAVLSLGFIAVMLYSGKLCQYCLAAHSANLVWWLLMEVYVMSMSRKREPAVAPRSSTGAAASSPPRRRVWPVLLAGAGAFALSMVALGSMDAAKRADDRQKSAAAAEASRTEMLAAADAAKAAAQRAATTAPSDPWGASGFTGRWRLGPEQAVARIVILSSYQCLQCKRLEGEATALVEKHPGKVSLSAIHFPLSSKCNPYANADPHPNACWGARLAEAAALVAGAKATLAGADAAKASSDAFWQMHNWLFSQNPPGSFTDASLPPALAQMGYIPDEITQVMQGARTLQLVQEDAAKGNLLGLSGTPMVFVNGIELKGWEAPRALENTVEAILAANPPASDASADRPVLASEKYVADWRDQPARNLGDDPVDRTRGDADAPVHVVVFGDYQESNNAKLDAYLAPLVESGRIRHTFRHFPGDQACNTKLQKTFFPKGCLAARAAEAAGSLGGDEAYWKMHAWLMANQASFTSETAAQAAKSFGLDPARFTEAMNSPEVTQAIQSDLADAAMLNVTQIPCVYVNGKLVPRWLREGDNVMDRIIAEAESAAPSEK